MASLPTVKQLQYLSFLAETGSFSKAAARGHVTQSTLSAGIAALEDLLGQPVVDRSRRTLHLTALGRDTLRRAHTILAEAEMIVARARSLGAPLSGPLRLGVIPTIAPYLLPRLLPALAAQFPALELQLHEDMTARLIESLRAGQLDVLLLAFPYKAAGLSTHILFEEPFMLACPRGRWAAPPPVKLDQLRGRDLLLLEDGHCLRDQAIAACRLQPAAEKKAFSATSLPTLIEMVRHGYGMTILPAMAVETMPPADIDIFPFRPPVPTRKVGLCWRAGNPRAAEFTALAQAVQDHLRAS
jgi:LysR family hydrogen peroxide-inducible transcriptional activator